MLLQASQSCSRPPCAPYARADQISHPCPPSQSLDKILGFFRDSGLGQLVLPWPAHGRHQKSAQRNQSQFRPDGIENPVRHTKGHISRPCPPSRLTKSDEFSGLGAWATGVHLGQLVVVINNHRRNVNSLSIDRVALRTLCAVRKGTSVALCAVRKSTVAPCPAIRLTKSEDFVGARGLGVPLPALTAHQQSTQRPQFRWRQGQHMLGVDATPGAPRRP